MCPFTPVQFKYSTDWWNGRGWKGLLGVSLVQLPAQAGPPRVSSSGLRPHDSLNVFPQSCARISPNCSSLTLHKGQGNSVQGIKRNCCAFAFQAHAEGSRNLQKACSAAAAHRTQRHTQGHGSCSPSCHECSYTRPKNTSSTSPSACQTKYFYLFLIYIPRWLQGAEYAQESPSHCQYSSWKTSLV